MRKIYEAIKRSSFYKKYLADGAFISFLKRVKHFLERKLDRVRSKLKKYKRHDRIILLLEQYFTLPREQSPEGACNGAQLGESQPDTQLLAKGIPVTEPIDVIIPIYNGYDYLTKLFLDLPKTKLSCRFLLVDDRSTDERVHELEHEFVRTHGNAVLLNNQENLGFVKSVNRGLREANRHVALVNTDTELPQGWLERLMEPILKDDKVASTTPYTNSATIFSFPNFCYNNPIYRDLDVETLDSYFRRVKPPYTQMPTGVGFCMGMNRRAIDQVGILDEETFGRGFGEENDWCQRAAKQGYKNIQVENLFVYHKHGGSFLSQEKKKLIEENLGKLRQRYPSYDGQVSELIHRDPNRKLRALLEQLIDTHERTSILYFDHSLGGGATSYLDLKKEEYLNGGCCVSVIRFDTRIHAWKLFFENDRGMQEYEIWSMEELLKVTAYFHYDVIYINELVAYPHLWEMQRVIVALKEQQQSQLIMLCHDFFALCPTINLLNTSRQYCGMPQEDACEKCYLQKGLDVQYQCQSRKEWVANWRSFLLHCTEVRAFSEDTLKRFQAAFGEDLPYSLVPHQVDYAFPIQKECKTTDTLNIGLLGVLTVHKGSEFIKALLETIDAGDLKIRIKLIGRCDGVNFTKYKNFSQTGAYQAQELPKLIYENDIDIFLIPSIWPETFSYTTEEIIRMGMPIAAFDLGAPAERVGRYEKGLILSREASLQEVSPKSGGTKFPQAPQALEEICGFAEKLGIWQGRVQYKKVLYLAEYISFSSRYRLEHLKEELLYQGVQGEFWETKTLPRQVDWKEVAAVVIYRCRYMEGLPAFMEEARTHGVPVLYDIDDYIFEYEAIRELPFMEGEEYRDFHVYSGLIRQCMEHSDRILVSTNHLKQAVSAAMPGKPVYVNRNVASAEMLILSAKAQRKKSKCSRRLVLGYFSGSNTHSRDFELISDLLLEFLEGHEEAYLKIVGCLELPEAFERVQERILREGFMDWWKLPESIAQVDINLMPLEDTLFHKCKSENKWMEAALVGVPTIGSWNEEIAGVTRPGENILLCQSEAEWKEKLEWLAAGRERREEMAKQAFLYVVEHKTTLCKDRELLRFVMGSEAFRE